MALLEEIEPLKLSALAELNAAPDLAALEHIKGAWIGPHGKFTALMKQLGSLPKEEKPAAGKRVNAAKAELEKIFAKTPVAITRPPARDRQAASADAGDGRYRARVPQDRFRCGRWSGSRR